MKAIFKKNIMSAMAVLLALLLVFTCIRVHAAWSDYGLPDSGTGSIKLSLYYEEDRGGSRSRVYIDGVSFEIYCVWTVSSEGKATVHAPFDTLLSAEDLMAEDTEFDELEGAAPKDSIRKLARDMAELSASAGLYATTAPSDSEGRISLSGVPFGGYLFVPVNEAGSVTKIVEEADGSRKEYTVDSFLVSVPVRTSQAEGTIPASYKADVDAFVKISIGVEEVPTTEPPETTEPPVTTESPTDEPPTTEPPVTTESPTDEPPTTEPPETTEPPVTTEPPETTEPPVTTEPPETTELPETTEPPATTEPPETTEPPTTVPWTTPPHHTTVPRTTTPPPPPDTGDHSHLLPYVILMSGAALMSGGLLIFANKKEDPEDESRQRGS